MYSRWSGVSSAPVVVWWLSDGKAGHDSQARGLINAIGRRLPLSLHRIAAPRGAATFVGWLLGRFPDGDALPDPELIIGCGHGTHLALLAARRARGGRIVLLLSPSLPLALFDLCIAPEHDGYRPRANLLITRGALNEMTSAARKLERRGLILVGGPSRHYRWNARALCTQVACIAGREPGWQWSLTSSRRTPETCMKHLEALRLPNLTLVRHQDVEPDWLRYRLAELPRVWVSEDSVSMVYEALSAGCAVGVLKTPRRRASRITRAVDALVASGLVTTYAHWSGGTTLTPPAEALAEAARCAEWLHRQWFPGR
jgi:hypothetical protein